MRRILCLLLPLLLAAPLALAQGIPMELFDLMDAEVAALNPDKLPQEVSFRQAGQWMSATVALTGQVAQGVWGVQTHGLVFDLDALARVTWDDVFLDGDAAAARVEEIADAALYRNAYAEYADVAPVPRDSFTVADGALTVHYPAAQLFTFSGRSGAFSFYAYELEGLLREEAPLARGDAAQAGQALEAALAEGRLPGPLAEIGLGGLLAQADETYTLADVPDLTYDYALCRYEDPGLRGVALLARAGEAEEPGAAVVGIMAERIDFSGLCPGLSTKADCVAALGAPDSEAAVESEDPYNRLPPGDTLLWRGQENALELHFVDGLLHSVTLLRLD